MKSKAYAYVRWSTKNQGGTEKDSLERQTRALELFKAEYGVELPEDHIYVEKGKSAYRGLNATEGVLKDILDKIASQEIKRNDYLIIESIDRISRMDINQAKRLIDKIQEKGILIYTTIDSHLYGLDENAFQDYIMLGVIAQRAHEESQTKSSRLKSAWQRRMKDAKEKGKPFLKNNVPFGLRHNATTDTYELHEEEAQEVRKLFGYMLESGSKTAIARINKENPIRRWSNGIVNVMMRKKYVIGTLTRNKIEYEKVPVGTDSSNVPTVFRTVRKLVFVEEIPNYFPAIIDHALFGKVKEVMANRKSFHHQGKASRDFTNIFQHVLKCEKCNGSLFFTQTYAEPKAERKKKYRTYTCANRAEKKCDASIVPFEVPFYEFVLFLKRTHFWASFSDEERAVMEDVPEYAELASVYKSFSASAQKQKTNGKRVAAEEELFKAKDYLDNLKQSLKAMKDGKVSVTFLEMLNEAETKVADASVKYDSALYDELQDKQPALYSVEKFVTLFKTEAGRFQLNSFLKRFNIQISVHMDEEGSGVFVVLKDGQMIHHETIDYPKVWQKPRAHYRVKDLGFDVNELL